MRTLLAALAASLTLPLAASAATVVDESTGQRFEVSQKAGGASYTCLAAGVRKFLMVKVYAVAFCVADAHAGEAKKWAAEHHAEKGEDLADALEDDGKFFDAVAGMPGDKLVIMKLVRDVPKDKMAESFQDSLGSVLPAAKIDQLVAAIPGDAKEGQTVKLHSHGGSLTIEVDGAGRKVDDPEVVKKLWRVWLGPKSVSPSLKEALAARTAGG